MRHHLFLIHDGSDAMEASHSRAVALEQQTERPTEAQMRATAAAVRRREELRAFERGNHFPGSAWVGVVVPLVAPSAGEDSDHAADALAYRLVASDSAASGVALVGQPEAEVWHKEAPPVVGVYAAECYPQMSPAGTFKYHWNGKCWSAPLSAGAANADVRKGLRLSEAAKIMWHHLIEADPVPQARKPFAVGDRVMTTYDGAATVTALCDDQELVTVKLDNGYEGCTGVAHLKLIPAVRKPLAIWRTAAQIPESERDGLWFYKQNGTKPKIAMEREFSCRYGLYLRAPEGTAPGTPYDPAMYEQPEGEA